MHPREPQRWPFCFLASLQAPAKTSCQQGTCEAAANAGLSAAGDAGLSLAADAGLSAAGDAGLSLAAGDAGLSLAADAGLSLAADAGLSAYRSMNSQRPWKNGGGKNRQLTCTCFFPLHL